MTRFVEIFKHFLKCFSFSFYLVMQHKTSERHGRNDTMCETRKILLTMETARQDK